MMVGVLVRLTDQELELWSAIPADEARSLMCAAIRFFAAVDSLPTGWQAYRRSGHGVELQLPEETIGEMDDFHHRHCIPPWVILRAAALQAMADYIPQAVASPAEVTA